MKIIYESIINLGYLFIPQHAFGLTSNLFKHMINFELTPIDDMPIQKLKTLY